MAIEWKKVRIDDIKAQAPGAIAIGPFGSRMKADVYVQEGTPVIRGTNLDGRTFGGDFVYVPPEFAAEMPNCLVTKDDLVFPHRGAIGEVGIVPDEGKYIISTSLMKLSLDRSEAIPEYVYHFFKSEQGRYELLKNASTVGTPGIATPLTSLRNIEIPLPSLHIQRRIAAILSAFDDKIELNRRMNRTLEQMARALFKSWFVDFDPVRAKMCGEEPEGMDAETAAFFPDELVEVDGQKVPKGWAWSPFDSNLVILGGGTPKTSNAEFWGGEIPWYSVVDVPTEGDVWVTVTEKTITEAGLHSSSTRLLPVGTSIISARGTVGKVALTAVPMAMNQSCYGLFPRDGESVNFVYFSTLAAVDELKRRTHGAVFDTITRDTLQSIKSVQPTPDVLRVFESRCGQLTAQVLSNVQESICLAQLRDSLLPRLLSGELDVTSWAEATEQVPA